MVVRLWYSHILLSEGGVTFEKSQLLFSIISTNVWSQNTFVANRSEDTARTAEKFARSQGTWSIELLPHHQESSVLGSYCHYRAAMYFESLNNSITNSANRGQRNSDLFYFGSNEYYSKIVSCTSLYRVDVLRQKRLLKLIAS